MEGKTAIASSDGKVVNRHFGRADKFYIVTYDETAKKINLLEERHIKPVYQSGEHSDSDLKAAAEALSDCKYMLVSKIGSGALNELGKNGIRVFEIPNVISEVLDKMFKYLEIEKLLYKGEY
ncbi:MAG: dinitrogenase iron-molybdenum cofactor biosynthesis protein [Clostridiales bacterium]|nr:dinitrogenase iron-molybdenum cofactor biosynthesis protein [Clostridiales bacterium]